MFVTFANIEEPNSLSEEEARHLHTEMLSGAPTITHTQAAETIQRGWEQTGEVKQAALNLRCADEARLGQCSGMSPDESRSVPTPK
jgi:hypothetical protein